MSRKALGKTVRTPKCKEALELKERGQLGDLEFRATLIPSGKAAIHIRIGETLHKVMETKSA